MGLSLVWWALAVSSPWTLLKQGCRIREILELKSNTSICEYPFLLVDITNFSIFVLNVYTVYNFRVDCLWKVARAEGIQGLYKGNRKKG